MQDTKNEELQSRDESSTNLKIERRMPESGAAAAVSFRLCFSREQIYLPK
jgi:hypothetical protein